jgi:rhodanese-related sulfurtransferase
MSASHSSTIETTQLRQLVETNPRTRLIDVRTPGEFAASHIEGSHNVPLDMLRAHRDDLHATHPDPVVLICSSGARADQARSLLDKAGVDELNVLRDGLTGWEHNGGPVSEGSGTWAMERQVRLAAGTLVLAGVLGSTRYQPLKWVAGAVGAGLSLAAITNTCAMSRALALLPHNRAHSPDPASALAALTGAGS